MRCVEAGGPHAPCRENGACEEKTRPFPTLTWMKRAGNMHRVSLGGRYGGPRGKRLREASRYRRNATLFDYGVTQDRTTMNTLRRLCGTMPPTHVSHPPTSFMPMWFFQTTDLRISAAKSPSRHRLHILKHVRVRPREHACWHSLGRTTGSCVQIMHADMRANMYGPMRSFPFMCSCCTETGLFRAISDRSRGAGVESPLVYLRRRRVLCTLPILQPCPPQHALHC